MRSRTKTAARSSETDPPQNKKGGSADTAIPMKKSTKWSLVACAFAFVLMLVYLFSAGEVGDLFRAFGMINPWFILLALLLMVVYWALEALATHIVLKKVCPGQKYKHTCISTMVGQYYNCVTPFASGGQPIQALYMNRYGVPASASISALMSRLILYHIAETLYCVVVLILRFRFFTEELAPLMVLALVGFGVCSAFIVFLLLVSFCKDFTMKVIRKIIFFLGRIRIIKNPQKRCDAIEDSMNASFNNMRFIVKEPVMILKVIVVTLLQLTAYFAISYVIFRGFGETGSDFLTVISCQAFVYMISAFMPMPGAMGASEGSYVGYFSHVYSDATLVPISTFIWRFLTFYLPIIQGIVLTLVLQRKQKKKDEAIEPEKSCD